MNKFILSTIAFFLCAVPTLARAETISLGCRTSPGFTTAIKRALQQRVLAGIDTSSFSDAKAKVTLNLVSIASSSDVVSTDDLVNGIDIHDSGDPTGLAFGVSGDLYLNSLGSCLYTYRVIITTRGQNIANGERISTRTDSQITITTPPYGRIRRSS